MDKYRIAFKCNKIPKAHPGLEGFNTDKLYVGRSFNGLYEISPAWGSGRQTTIIEKDLFDQYFEEIKDNSNEISRKNYQLDDN